MHGISEFHIIVLPSAVKPCSMCCNIAWAVLEANLTVGQQTPCFATNLLGCADAFKSLYKHELKQHWDQMSWELGIAMACPSYFFHSGQLLS